MASLDPPEWIKLLWRIPLNYRTVKAVANILDTASGLSLYPQRISLDINNKAIRMNITIAIGKIMLTAWLDADS